MGTMADTAKGRTGTISAPRGVNIVYSLGPHGIGKRQCFRGDVV